MAGSQISTSVTIINSLHGFQALSLTNPGTSALTKIEAGGVVEIAGAMFHFGSDEEPQATTWTAIGNGRCTYLTLTPSGTAGSQILTAKWTDVVGPTVTWVPSKNGWYMSAASSIRAIGGCMKTTNTQANHKFILPRPTIWREGAVSGSAVIDVLVEIGTWDMETTSSKAVTHNLYDGEGAIRSFSVDIDGAGPLDRFSADFDGTIEGGVRLVSDSFITLARKPGGVFHSSTYSAATGVVYMRYELPK